MKRRYVLDGDAFATLEESAKHFSHVVLHEYRWSGNLDAFNDLLRGGFGTPDDGFVLVWQNHQKSRRDLGHVETARRLERLLSSCHPSNRACVRQHLEAARRGEGPTLFDEIVEIIRDHGEVVSKQKMVSNSCWNSYEAPVSSRMNCLSNANGMNDRCSWTLSTIGNGSGIRQRHRLGSRVESTDMAERPRAVELMGTDLGNDDLRYLRPGRAVFMARFQSRSSSDWPVEPPNGVLSCEHTATSTQSGAG